MPSETQLPVLHRVWKQSKEIDSVAGQSVEVFDIPKAQSPTLHPGGTHID